MDILLDSSGDIVISEKGDIVLRNSVAQKINIRLRWLAGEWRWDEDEGLPYFENLMIKDPDIDIFESYVREKIFEVDEVIKVGDVKITFDSKTRKAKIAYVAYTDFETIKREVIV